MTIAMQICEGMERVADVGLVHRDLATRNVLVFEFSEDTIAFVDVRVADFGLTKQKNPGASAVDVRA